MIPPALPSTPLRHLEYSYSVDYQNVGSRDTGAIGTRVGSAKDGGLVVRVAEWVQNQPRAQQSFVCAVYPDMSVSCPSTLPVTDVESTMLGFLGRGFVDPTKIVNNQWTAQYSNKAVTVSTQFTVLSADATGKLISVEGQSTAKSVDGSHPDWLEKMTFTYDLSKEVPTLVDDLANQAVRGEASYKSHMRFELKSDSLAGGT